MAASDDPSTIKIGMDILMAGMALNLASFTVFISLIVYFDYTTRKAYRGERRSFHPMIGALYLSWTFVMVISLVKTLSQVRLIFRTVEFATGWTGPINTNETYFYCLDASMMYATRLTVAEFRVLATVVFVVYFPARYGILSNKRLNKEIEERKFLAQQGQAYELFARN